MKCRPSHPVYFPDIFHLTMLGIWAWYHLLMSNMPIKTSRFSGGPHDQMKTTSVASMLSCTEVEEERGEEEGWVGGKREGGKKERKGVGKGEGERGGRGGGRGGEGRKMKM